MAACDGAPSGPRAVGGVVTPGDCPITADTLANLSRLPSFAGTAGYIPGEVSRPDVSVAVTGDGHRMRVNGVAAIRVIRPAGAGQWTVTVLHSYVMGALADPGFDAEAAALREGATTVRPCAMALALATATQDTVTRDALTVLTPATLPYLLVAGTGDGPDAASGGGAEVGGEAAGGGRDLGNGGR